MKVYNSDIPFINYAFEDKSGYPTASSQGYYDPYDDFLIGKSTYLLPNISFIFKRTERLREVALFYEAYGKYTDFEIDSEEHIAFRLREEGRRKDGFTANCKLLYKDIDKYDELISKGKLKEADALLQPLHITGDHYNFINYTILNKLVKSSIKVSVIKATGEIKVSGRKYNGAPETMDAQYWWYKIQEFARNNAAHVIGGKARRKGCSYMAGADSANSVNLNPGTTILHVAWDYKYLTEGRMITNMALDMLDHYDNNTPFKRGIISRNLKDLYLGYKEKDNTDAGYKSHIISVSTQNNPDAPIGKDAKDIKVEELSNLPNFDDMMSVTEPTTRTGSITTGLITAWGTGGSTEGKWIVFERNFYNPKKHNFLVFENIWDKESRHKGSGYFIPYVQSLQGYNDKGESAIDNDGNSIYHIAEEVSKKEREDKKGDKKLSHKDFIAYCGQYANMPSEAFSSTGTNLFVTPALLSHIDRIKHDPDRLSFIDGDFALIDSTYKFRSNQFLRTSNQKTHDYIEFTNTNTSLEDYTGCIRVFHFPYRDRLGNIPKGMYRISYDTVAKDKESISKDNSLCSMSVWMHPNPYIMNVTRLRCASYVGRRPTLKENDNIAYYLCNMYNADIGFERNRGETKSNFGIIKQLSKLLKEPTSIWNNKIKDMSPTEYGIDISNDIRKYHGIRLCKEQLYEAVGKKEDGTDLLFFETIDDIDFLREIACWDIEGNFDRVSDFIIEAYYYKYFCDKLVKQTSNNNETTKSIESVFARNWY